MKTYEVLLKSRVMRTELVKASSIEDVRTMFDDPDEDIMDIIEAPQ